VEKRGGERLLHQIDSPEDLRKLTWEQVEQVTRELREEIVGTVSKTGGHLASSLGAIELLTAIHCVFDTPRDRLVLDVGHQGYPHKMLTGRREAFDRIGQADGISKFLCRSESEYDPFGAGHAGTSISAALGIARAIAHQGRDNCAIAFIGDGGMTAGMAFEALNHAGHLKQKNLVVVLNDNEMSISPNVGALSSYLSRKLSKPMVRRMKDALLGAQGRGVAQGLLLAGGLVRGAELQVRGPDPGAPRERPSRDFHEREGDAGQRRGADPGACHHREGIRL
jgi:1-deoxy-D-xylulose-5-phosphate synthase